MIRIEIGVAPRVGAWIETLAAKAKEADIALSHPVWVRGLKLNGVVGKVKEGFSRTPCGCVD